MGDLALTVDDLDSPRLLLALLFFAGYALAIGGLASVKGRRWGAAVAGVASLGFVGLTRPWEQGALLVAWAVVATGVFIGAAWALSVAVSRRTARAALPVPVSEPPALPSSAPAHPRRARRRLSAS